MASSVQPKFGYPGLRISYTCAEAVLAGQVVERRTGTRLVGVAAAGSVKTCGVALWDVPAARATIQGPQVGDGFELTVVRGCVIAVTFDDAAAVGDRLMISTLGKVTPIPATDATSAATVAASLDQQKAVVGEAFEAVAADAVGLAVIY
jgi:hypothetical protein